MTKKDELLQYANKCKRVADFFLSMILLRDDGGKYSKAYLKWSERARVSWNIYCAHSFESE